MSRQPIDFTKYHKAKTRAKDRTKQIMHDLEVRNDCYVVIPPEVDPFNGNLEDEIEKVLYESELYEASNKRD